MVFIATTYECEVGLDKKLIRERRIQILKKIDLQRKIRFVRK